MHPVLDSVQHLSKTLLMDGDRWIFAAQLLNSTEERYSVNEKEILGVIWSIGCFKYYLYGKDFTVITDDRALKSTLKEHQSNKSYNSQFFRRIDRLLPYNFTIELMP